MKINQNDVLKLGYKLNSLNNRFFWSINGAVLYPVKLYTTIIEAEEELMDSLTSEEINFLEFYNKLDNLLGG